jgi:hypothetical protein
VSIIVLVVASASAAACSRPSRVGLDVSVDAVVAIELRHVLTAVQRSPAHCVDAET